MGAKFTEELKEKLWSTLGIVLKAHIAVVFNYKQFCGTAAMCERLYCKEFANKQTTDNQPQESKSEIEVADFDRLLTKLEQIQVRQPSMRKLLVELKESGMAKGQVGSGRSGQILTRRRSRFEFL